MKKLLFKVCVCTMCMWFTENNVEVLAETKNKDIDIVYKYEDNFEIEKIKNEYENLFDYLIEEKIIKADSRILDIYIIGDELVLNVNEKFIYIGGTYREKEVINKIVAIGLEQKNITLVSVLVNGKVSDSSEGINLHKLNKLFVLH